MMIPGMMFGLGARTGLAGIGNGRVSDSPSPNGPARGQAHTGAAPSGQAPSQDRISRAETQVQRGKTLSDLNQEREAAAIAEFSSQEKLEQNLFASEQKLEKNLINILANAV